MNDADLTLVLDTSICGLRLALVCPESKKSGVPVWQGGLNEAQGSAARLSGILRDGLNASGFRADSIQRALVSCGPGSFTGIRVGIAFARGLFASRLELAEGCSSLGLFASSESARRGCPVAVYLPATRTAGYVVIANTPNDLQSLPMTVDDFAHVSPASLSAGTVTIIAGVWPALALAFDLAGIKYELKSVSDVADAACMEMCRLAASRRIIDGGSGLRPIYLRRSSVEEKNVRAL